MATDKSTEKPGKMGYDIPGLSQIQIAYAEAKMKEQLIREVESQPRFSIGRAEEKPANAGLLRRVAELQMADGIEDGFSFLHLVKALNSGSSFNWIQQYIGSCVASGDMRTTAYRMMAEVFLLNQVEQLPGIDIDGTDSLAFFAPYNYRAGRKIGGLNGGDGSFCSAHIKGKMQYGHLPCSTPGIESDLLPEPRNESTYRKWGNSNELLEKFAPVGKKFPLTNSEFITSASSGKDVLTTLFAPFNICSNWGFAPQSQHPTWKFDNGDPVWIYKRSGSWAHNMSIVGIVKCNGNWWVIVENSWGMEAHKNGPFFVIPLELFDTWLSSAECASVGEIDLSDNAPMWEPQLAA